MRGLFVPEDKMAASGGRIPSLDGLRAVSILIVLCAHFIDSRIFPGGFGVYVFFVISGFLITRLLLVEQASGEGVSLRLFYVRRIVRLYPVIIVYTATVIGLDILLQKPYNFLEPASGLFYFANYLSVYFEIHNIAPQMPFAVFWSLSVEEHFYILFPLVFVLCRGNPIRLIWVLAGLCIGCLALRLGMAGLHPHLVHTLTFYAESQYRIDSIGYGVLLALACQTDRGRQFVKLLARPLSVAVAVAMLLVCFTVNNDWFRETIRYTLLGCSVVVLMAAVLFGEWLRRAQQILNTAVVVWVGRLSYSIYIWHEGISSYLVQTGLPAWQLVFLKMAATLAVASVSYYAVEQPFLMLRRNLRHGQRLRPGYGPIQLKGGI